MARMKFGAFLAPHHPIGEHPTLQFRSDLDFAAQLDRLGFDEFWCGEHHSTGWETIASPELFLAADLGEGESQVIAVAVRRKAQLVLIDELKARRIAGQVYGLRVRGSAGILIQAKRAGLVSAVRPLFTAMRQEGYYLSTRLIEMACREAGEPGSN